MVHAAWPSTFGKMNEGGSVAEDTHLTSFRANLCKYQTRPLAPPTNNIKGPPKLNLGHGFAKARLANTKQSHTPTPGSLYRCFSQGRTGYKQTSNNNGKTIHGQDTSGKPL